MAVAAEEERSSGTAARPGAGGWRSVPGVLLDGPRPRRLRRADLSATVTLVVVGIVALVTVVWGFLETIRWKYTITNRRVFVRHGLVSIREQTARLERVQDITLHQTLFDRMFGVGSLQIDTAGSSGGALEFKALLEPTQRP